MTNLALKLAAAASAAVALSACVTNPSKPDADNKAPIKTSGVKMNADCSVGTVGSAKNSTMGSDGACVEINIYGAKQVANQAAPKAAAEGLNRKNGGPGTKNGLAASPKAQPTLQIVTDPSKNLIEFSLVNCGAKSTGAFNSAVGFGKDLLGKLGSTTEAAIGAVAGRAGASVGGPLANVGRKAGQDAATAATRSAKTTAAPVATNAGNIANDTTAKCDAEVSKVAAGDLTTELKKLITNWKTANPNLTPVVTFSSTLPARQEEIVKNAVGLLAPIVTVAPQ